MFHPKATLLASHIDAVWIVCSLKLLAAGKLRLRPKYCTVLSDCFHGLWPRLERFLTCGQKWRFVTLLSVYVLEEALN